MSTEKNVQTVKDFFAAIGRGDREGLLALVAEDVEWIIPSEHWPLAGTRHGHAGLADLVKTQSETMEISLTEPREFVAQGDRVLVVGFARGKIKATTSPSVRDGRLTSIREYIDMQALARASQMDASGLAYAGYLRPSGRGRRWISRGSPPRTPRARRMPNRNTTIQAIRVELIAAMEGPSVPWSARPGC